jgi:hypothetical protein
MSPSPRRREKSEEELYDIGALYKSVNKLDKYLQEIGRKLGREVIAYTKNIVAPYLLHSFLTRLDRYLSGAKETLSRIDRSRSEIEGRLKERYKGKTEFRPEEIYDMVSGAYTLVRLEDMRKDLQYRVVTGEVLRDVLSSVYERVRRGEKVTWGDVFITLIGEGTKKMGEGMINYLLSRIFPSSYQAERRLSTIVFLLISLTIPLFVLHILNVSTKGMFLATPIASASTLFLSFLLLFVVFYYWMKQKQ